MCPAVPEAGRPTELGDERCDSVQAKCAVTTVPKSLKGRTRAIVDDQPVQQHWHTNSGTATGGEADHRRELSRPIGCCAALPLQSPMPQIVYDDPGTRDQHIIER